MIKLNLRWLVQALALIFSIVCFTIVFDSSKILFKNFSTVALLRVLLWCLLFLLSFFLLMFTSYLKQRANSTLRHPIKSFESLIQLLHLENYRERAGVSDARRRKQAG
jgi:hypothetical protein